MGATDRQKWIVYPVAIVALAFAMGIFTKIVSLRAENGFKTINLKYQIQIDYAAPPDVVGIAFYPESN
jgi:hypothetical protein